ncbi:MAG: TonB-dependent receptor domain-containing protein [Ignavibacteria bacterium]
MLKNWIILLSIYLLLTCISLSQSRGDRRGMGGSISGEVHDQSTNAPIEYANIILFSAKDSAQVTGAISGTDGKFVMQGVRPGSYYANVQFIGYEKVAIDNISVGASEYNVNLGKIIIRPSAITLGNVEVSGQRNPVTYQIDKKVVDVSQIQTAVSGNAAEVLENVPSVTVDIDGNVSLRGSSNFTVLIDGRPSVVDAQDILQQTPASAIEKIEIITNPSAKYSAEGNAGIINLILKKNVNLGLSGIINANAGLNEKYGGSFLFEYKTQGINYNFGLDYNRRLFPGSSKEDRRYISPEGTSFLSSTGSREWGRKSMSLKGGVEFNLSDNDILNLGGRVGSRDFNGGSTSNYNSWSDTEPSFYYISRGEQGRSGDYYDLNLNYYRTFGVKTHRLSGEFTLSHDNSDELNLTSEFENEVQFGGKKTTEFGPSTEFEGRINYALPFSEVNKFETGVQWEFEDSKEGNGLYEFNPATNSYDFMPSFSNTTNSSFKELSLYSVYSDELNNFGFQGGVRSEYTFRNMQLEETNEKFAIDEWDFFPTFHTSYKFSVVSQIMASYARRIDRPRNWELEPFYTWMNSDNVRIGNPELKPQYIDSYEFGFQTAFLGISLTNDFYYRMTHNKVDRIQSVYPDAENVTLHTVENIGKDYSAGSEFTFMIDPFQFWSIDLMGNLYNYKIEGVLNEAAFSRESFNWSSRINNSFKLGGSTQVQFNTIYNSPTVSSQGKREGFFSSDLSVKQDLMNKQLSLTLQIRDLFSTAKFEYSSQGPDFYSYNYFNRESPMVMLDARFNFNSFKEDRRERTGQEDNNTGGDEF